MAKSDLNPQSKATGGTTRCEEGGKEIITGSVPVEAGSTVKLNLTLCKAAFRIVVFLDGVRKVDQEPVVDQFEYLLPSLAPGLHNLHWGYIGAGTDWMLKSEVSVNGTVVFRQRKTNDSDLPLKQTFLFLEVQP